MTNFVVNYFRGEKMESYVFIALGVLALALALYFLLVLKTAFWTGVAIPFVAVALLEFVVGYTIATRSPSDIRLVESLIRHQPEKIQSLEIVRMEKVMRNFVLFRYVEISLILVGVLLMYGSAYKTEWTGLGFGIFVQASLVLCLDFFAEHRGRVYLDFLNGFIDKL